MIPRLGWAAIALLLGIAAGCSGTPGPGSTSTATEIASWSDLDPASQAFLDTLEEKTFRFFWDQSDAKTGMSPDRWPTQSFVSVASVGFALTAYPIGVERGYVTRAQARDRTLTTLRYFWDSKQDTARSGATGYKGFFYHFLDPRTGVRFETVELSTQDTALLLAGVLFCQSYFDGKDEGEIAIRALAESLYVRADWNWAQPRPPAIAHGWDPETGHLPYDWGGYNETVILFILALGSPRHPVTYDAWRAFTAHYKWGTFQGQEYLGFAPLFGHQYSHVWLDFRGIQDSTMRAHDSDYFENSRRATLAQRSYAIANPSSFRDYGVNLWGLTACDGPIDTTLMIAGRQRTFRTYNARGACFTGIEDDGTIAPTAAAASLPFAPEVVVPTLIAMRRAYGTNVYGEYGFVDALNPTLIEATRVQHGRIVPGVGWFDTDYLGIDQGPIVAMIENHRTGLVWNTMRKNPHIIRGLKRAGFTGGWLDAKAGAQ